MNIASQAFKVKALVLLCFVSVINNMASMSIVMGVGRLAFELGAGAFSTLPVAVNYSAIMLGSIPVSYLFIRIGIRWGLCVVNLFSAVGSGGIILSIYFESFWLLLASLIITGMTLASMHQMRYIATDAVSEKYKPLAMSLILSMPIVGGLVFPQLVEYMQNTFGTDHRLSSYNMLFVSQGLLTLLVVALLIVFKLDIDYKPKSSTIDFGVLKKSGVKQAIIITALGYATMTFLMTATPLYMQSLGYHLHHSNTLIGYHVIGMSLPSLFIAYIIMKFGINTTVKLGMMVYFGTFVFNVFGNNIIYAVADYIIDLLGIFHIEMIWDFSNGLILDDTYISLMIGLILLGVGWSAVYAGGSNYVGKILTPDERMRGQGVIDTFVFMATGIAGLVAGVTMYYIGWIGTNIVLLVCILITGIANYQLKGLVK